MYISQKPSSYIPWVQRRETSVKIIATYIFWFCWISSYYCLLDCLLFFIVWILNKYLISLLADIVSLTADVAMNIGIDLLEK